MDEFLQELANQANQAQEYCFGKGLQHHFVFDFTDNEKELYYHREKEETDRFECEKTLYHQGFGDGLQEGLQLSEHVMQMIDAGKTNGDISDDLKIPVDYVVGMLKYNK